MPHRPHAAPTPTDPAQPIHVAAGKQFTIVLEANHTTGFSWALAAPAHPHVVPQGEPAYQEAAHPPGMVGVGGWEVWTFAARTHGQTTLTFHYRRPFDPQAAPAEVATFRVIVQ